jgi:glutamate synthase domain-containing protein 2
MKVMSKMGISTYMSYCGAQIFEAVGLNKSLVDKYFKGTSSTVEGIGLFEVAEEALRLHSLAFGKDPCWRTASTPAANTPSACAAKTTCGRRTRSPSCSTRPAPTTSAPIRSTRS